MQIRSASLIPFLQDQFARGEKWCWETVIEEISAYCGATLDEDRLTYAGGVIRTGPFAFRCNNAAWKDLCRRIAGEPMLAEECLVAINNALRSGVATGIAERWLNSATLAAEARGGEIRRLFTDVFSWRGYTYQRRNRYSPQLVALTDVIYGLWRLDDNG